MNQDGLKHFNLLIVDDNPGDVAMISEILNDGTAFYHIASVHTCDAFREIIQIKSFDLILMDINLCGENGVELCRHFKRTEAGKHTKVIVNSGLLDSDFLLYARHAGADCVMDKNVPPETWRHVITSLLDTKPASLKTKILLIDDEEIARKVIKRRLEFHGFDVVTAGNADEGFARVVSEQPNLILLDIVMPEVSGFDICAMLKKMTRTNHIPVIFISSVLDESTVRMGTQLGAYACLSKPYEPDELVETIRRAAAHQTGGPATA